MRVNGRLLRPSTLAERRVLIALGIDSIRVPRHENPFRVARLVEHLADTRGSGFRLLKRLVHLEEPESVA
jgi:hypothetical protein